MMNTIKQLLLDYKNLLINEFSENAAHEDIAKIDAIISSLEENNAVSAAYSAYPQAYFDGAKIYAEISAATIERTLTCKHGLYLNET